MESHTIVDQWGVAYCCIADVHEKMCGNEEFFMMYPPEGSWEPVSFCAKCKQPSQLAEAHIYQAAIHGIPVPPERKVSELERLRRQIVEDNQSIEKLRLEYASIKNNDLEGDVKEMKLQHIKDQAEFCHGMIAEQTAHLRKRLLHG